MFDWSGETGIPVAWNLDGGYQESEDGDISLVLEIHRNTALACIGSREWLPSPLKSFFANEVGMPN